MLFFTFEPSASISKACTRCDGDGEVQEFREAHMDELSDEQIKVLTEADIYRETGGKSEEDINQQAQNPSMPSGMNTPSMPSKSRF